MINTIEANMRTENLLQQSQSLAQELQQTNLELQEKAQLLAHQNQEVERKNSEVEQARQALEEKAKQLALTSKYKSEFLANMSHTSCVRRSTCLLILSDQPGTRNTDGNLTSRQVEFARTIQSAGNDLLVLINDILDFSKIESGTVVVDVSELHLEDLQLYRGAQFPAIRGGSEERGLRGSPGRATGSRTTVVTDASKRLQQIRVEKPAASNAFKFGYRTAARSRSPSITPIGGWGQECEELDRAHEVLAFSVSDSGIGISADKQQIIFEEAFQQADSGSTSRKYGGTGLRTCHQPRALEALGGARSAWSAPRGRAASSPFISPQTSHRLTLDPFAHGGRDGPAESTQCATQRAVPRRAGPMHRSGGATTMGRPRSASRKRSP